MLKVQNKQVVAEVAKTTYCAQKKRNTLTISAIVLTTFLIAVVTAIGAGYWSTIAERQIRMNGMDYDFELSEPKVEQVMKIRSMDQVKTAGLAVKCAILTGYNGLELDKIRMYWLDEICWREQTVPALEQYTGTYPEKKNEIMLSTSALKAMRISKPVVGQSLPVQFYTLEEGSKGENRKKEFILSGWYTDYSGIDKGYVSYDFYKASGVKQTDLTQGALKITWKSFLYSEQDIVDMQKEIGLTDFQYMDADVDTIANFIKIIIGLSILLLMIFVSGCLFIYNTLYLSVSKDIRYYGQLKTLGMTSVQLRNVVYKQAIWNALIGIPIGLAAAILTAQIIVPQIIKAVNPTISANDVAKVPVWIYLIAALVAFLTNLISSWKPARMVADCSPIEAMRYETGMAGRRRHVTEGCGLFSMTKRNMFRDKKQAAVILLSFVIAVSMFISIHVVIRENEAQRILNASYNYDIRYKNKTTLNKNKKNGITDAMMRSVAKVDGVESVRKVTSTRVAVPYQEDVYGDYYKDLYNSRFSPGNYEEDIAWYINNPDESRFNARFIGIDEKGFLLLNQQLGGILDQGEFEAGKIAVAVKMVTMDTAGDYGIAGKQVRFSLPESLEPEQEHTIEIAAVGDNLCNPAYFAGGYTPDFIVSEKYAKELMKDTFTELINVVYKKPFSQSTEEAVNQIFAGNLFFHDSKLERYEEMKQSEIQVKVLGTSIGIMIAMLAVLNYMNMIAAGIQNRWMEFAILESIGMTAKQIKKMLILEGVGYALLSLTFAMGIGIPMSHLVFHNLNIYRIPYSFPWLNNIALFLVIILVCIGTPVFIYQKTQKASIIERLRSGNLSG